MPEDVAANARYERAVADRRFRAAFEADYGGAHPPMDALWWAAHPDSPSPSGTPSPYARFGVLRRDIYRPDATDADRAELEQLASLFEQEQQVVARAADAASAAVLGGTRPRRRTMARPRRAMLLGVIAAVVIGAVGGVIGTLRVDAMQPQNVPPLAPESAVHTRASVAIFARSQHANDLPIMKLGPTLVRSSIRHLVEEPVTGTQVFAAHDVDGEICLLAVHDSVYSASCVTRAAFARAGIVLSWTQPGLAPSGSIVSARADVPVLAEWLPTGVVLAQAQL